MLNDAPFKARDIVTWSPMAALTRLYGSRGPALVVGLRGSEEPRSFASESYADPLRGIGETVGWLQTSRGREVRFVFEWQADSGRLQRIAPWQLERAYQLLAAEGSSSELARDRFKDFLVAPPFPSAPLDPAARLLLRLSCESFGLAFASRCLAVWWFLTEGQAPGTVAGVDELTEVRAAAIEATVARRGGIRVTANSVAVRYGCAVEATRAETRRVQTLLKGAPAAGW